MLFSTAKEASTSMNGWFSDSCRTEGDCLKAGIAPALMPSKTVGPSLKLSEECRTCCGICSKGVISVFSLSGLSVVPQLLKSSWRSSGSGRDSAIPVLQCIPRRREMKRGWGRPPNLRYLLSGLPTCCHPCNLSANQSKLQGLGQVSFSWLACRLGVSLIDVVA